MTNKENKTLPTRYEVLTEAERILADANPQPRSDAPEVLKRQRVLLEGMKHRDEAVVELRQLRVNDFFVLIKIISPDQVDRSYFKIKQIRHGYNLEAMEFVAIQEENPKELISFSPLRPVIIQVK